MSRRYFGNIGSAPTDYYLKYDLQYDFLDSSGNNNHGIVAGTLPTLTVKDGKECAYFDGSKSFKTQSPITVGNSFSICLEVWYTGTTVMIIAELGANFNSTSGFAIYTGNTFITGGVSSLNGSTRVYNTINSLISNTGSWVKLVFTFNALKNDNELEVCTNQSFENLNRSLKYNNPSYSVTNTLFIGRRGGVSGGFTGYIRNFKIYSRELSRHEAFILTRF